MIGTTVIGTAVTGPTIGKQFRWSCQYSFILMLIIYTGSSFYNELKTS